MLHYFLHGDHFTTPKVNQRIKKNLNMIRDDCRLNLHYDGI